MSIKHNEAGLLPLNKILIGDLLRIMIQALCYAMKDAIRCFNRIDHTPAILVLTRYDLDYKSIRTLFRVIQKSLHTIKMRYRVSDPVYGNKLISLAGYGQENGVGHTLWELVSSSVIKKCKEAGHRIEIETMIIKLILSLMGFAFVDNTD